MIYYLPREVYTKQKTIHDISIHSEDLRSDFYTPFFFI